MSDALDDDLLSRRSAFMRASGFELDEISGSRVTGTLDVGPDHHTPFGVVHGGVYAAAVESAASIGATAAVRGRGQFAVGVHNATDFVRPVREGRLDVVAEPLTQGRTQQVWQVAITRADDGKLVAHGSVRLHNLAQDQG